MHIGKWYGMNIRNFFDKNIIFTFINYITKTLFYPFLTLCVPFFLNNNYQGYWYTFGSIGMLTVFADLGFTTIITQLSAHEYAYLKIENRKLNGDQANIERLSSLFIFMLRWLIGIIVIASFIIYFVGVFTFSRQASHIPWQTPWILYVLATLLNFGGELLLSFFEGCNQFYITQKIRATATIAYVLTTIVCLVNGYHLWALGIGILIKAMVYYGGLSLSFYNVLLQLIKNNHIKQSWLHEILGLLSKYALSWMAGYLASQLYNPLVFSMYGAAAAGKVGFSLSVVQAVYGMAAVWLTVAMPKLNICVEKHDWAYMDRLFRKNMLLTIITYAIGAFGVIILLCFPVLGNILQEKLLGFFEIGTLLLVEAFQTLVAGMAIYLRAHKAEPLLKISIFSGFLTAITTYLFLKFGNIHGVFLGYLLSQILITPWEYRIFKHLKGEWHK